MATAGKPARLPRENKRLAVRFGLPGEPLDCVAFTADVSPLGLFVVTAKLPAVGKQLIIQIQLPDQTLRLEGWVAWSKTVPVQLRSVEKTGFGVRLDLPPEAWFNFVYKPA